MRNAKIIIPNLVTTANIVCGFASVLASIDGNFVAASWAIIAAAVFDLVDGRLARVLNASSSFGEEYDTLSDLLSFGVAPSILYYQCGVRGFGAFGAALALFYLLCVAFRLARFAIGGGAAPSAYFQGLSSPPAAATASAYVMFSNDRGLEPDLHRGLSVAVFTLLGLLMISHLRFPSFKKMNWKSPSGTAILIAFAALAALALTKPALYLFPILMGFLILVMVLDVRYRLGARSKS